MGVANVTSLPGEHGDLASDLHTAHCVCGGGTLICSAIAISRQNPTKSPADCYQRGAKVLLAVVVELTSNGLRRL